MNGYQGRVAMIELGERRYRDIFLDEGLVRKYIGGSGLGTYFLLKFCTPGTKPLSPENPLIFTTGPFQGTGIPTSGRHQVVTRSPLTGIFLESDAGGSFGFHLKRAGYDGLIITGRSERPVYLKVLDGQIGFEDGQDLWGLDTMETDARLKSVFGERIGVSCIGPAGEKQIPLAGIFHDGTDARAAGRGGAGAVMGSKNLKAIVASGSSGTEVHDRKALTVLISEKNAILKEKGAGMTLYGTVGGMGMAEELGDLPIRNWKQGSWKEEVREITGQRMAETILTGNYGCVACPVRCGRVVNIGGGNIGGPEYETMGMLGSNCLVNDLDAIARANEQCNRLGIDTISTGSVIAFAMECYEHGILTGEQAGMPLHWGSGEAVNYLVTKIGNGEGIGGLLGRGTRAAAKELGRGAERFAIHSKGLEFPAHDPRCFKSLAAGYATSVRGACHLNGYSYAWERSATFPEFGYPEKQDRTTDKGKGIMNARFQNLSSLVDSLKICKFILLMGVNLSDISRWLKCVTGWEYSIKELEETGERIYNMKRIFNAGLGLDRSDDTLPQRILAEPRGSGGSANTLPDLGMQLDEYYSYRGWSNEGIPLEEKLEGSGLREFMNWIPS
ncbi:MAG: aldehyde ferredoxin oxidoreductase family protein [Thermovirgaceae bacterium]|jgi:aldehyde:ferredoxin oxidoreductase|nr:aldehyde ferredoxin oxidoreductase family protein [Synergistales bacterium]MDI9393387.1 aldehyde ferredoxin oxidoreductase family protein [Synergistota bacterium]MDY0178405.1 aldehyde ferredoxin oxidoreductase family protein [Synergistaceae bacterium]HRW87633.1 aldehyde ferredoxin oxidoreductase family protein [Thermovirgaceae bacterium]MDD3133459.1 aldehyde ferredoxin oxidoreductase family protein [Synergistales bacterium]